MTPPAAAEGGGVGSEEGGTLLAADWGWEEGPVLRGAGTGFALESTEGAGGSLGWEGTGGYGEEAGG